MNAEDRFLKYVRFDTQSDPESSSAPSSAKQLRLAEELRKELEELGLEDVILSSGGVVYGTLPANTDKKIPSLGLIAHMDTAGELTGANVSPRVIPEWDGSEIVLNEEYSMNPEDFPELRSVIGDSIIVTDGTTLLGNDDKAGIAIIMQAVAELAASDEPHGEVRVSFTPDEEIGRGVENFDLSLFPVDYAYTVDGGAVDEVDYETFNAAQAVITVEGKSIHPGSAKDQMVNAVRTAALIYAQLPQDMVPEHTSGREGFIHLISLEGTVESARMILIIRDHDAERFEQKKKLVASVADTWNILLPGRIRVEIQDQYRNMKDYADEDLKAVKKAARALKEEGFEANSHPVRGGTDGAVLSARGLFTPNLGTGGGNCHGRYEFASIDKMRDMVRILKRMAREEEA